MWDKSQTTVLSSGFDNKLFQLGCAKKPVFTGQGFSSTLNGIETDEIHARLSFWAYFNRGTVDHVSCGGWASGPGTGAVTLTEQPCKNCRQFSCMYLEYELPCTHP